jgi:hypothetical protein
MEKVAAAGMGAGGHGGKQVGRCGALALAACSLCPVLAQDAGQLPGDALLAEARKEQPSVRVQVQASTLPRLDVQDSGFQAPRVDVSLFPARAGGIGAVVGMSGFSGQQPPMLGLAPMRPSVDFGLRFSQKLLNDHQIDVTAWRRMQLPDDAYTLSQAREPVYGARVELNLKPARKGGFGFDRGFLGLQLESGARISIKRKDGRPMIYYRTTF